MGTAEMVLNVQPLTLPIDQTVDLIKERIAEGDHAMVDARKYYFEAGFYLGRIKPQILDEGREKNQNEYLYWGKWVEKNIERKVGTVEHWIHGARRLLRGEHLENLEDTKTTRAKIRELVGSKTMSSVTHPSRHRSHRPQWHLDVKPLLPNQYDVARLRQQRQERDREQQLQRHLGFRLIDIGYKVLAAKLHPDAGGSAEAMARLNAVRKHLKGAL